METKNKAMELAKLKSIKKKYGITEQMLSEAEQEQSPTRLLQGMKCFFFLAAGNRILLRIRR